MKNIQRCGFSTIELLITFTIAIIFLSSAFLVALGGQTAGLDATQSTHGLAIAMLYHSIIENLRPNSEIPTELFNNDQYVFSSLNKHVSPCTEVITTNTEWQSEKQRILGTTLTSMIGSTTKAFKLHTEACDPTPPTQWNAAQLLEGENLGSLISGTGTDMALFTHNNSNFALITTLSSSSSSPSIWIASFTQQSAPFLLSSISIPGGALRVVIKDNFAYVLSGTSTKQLTIIDINDPLSISQSSIVATLTLPNMTSSCSACLTPKSIAYFDGYIYIGLPYIANIGGIADTRNSEFHVICVSKVSVAGCTPQTPLWLGSFNVNHNVEDIVVRHAFNTTNRTIAYLATSASEARYPELTILDVTKPNAITQVSSFSPSGNLYGTALSLLGPLLFLGRERATGENKDLFVLNIENSAIPLVVASHKLGLRSGTRITEIISQGTIIFVATSDSRNPLFIFEKNEDADLSKKEACSNLNGILSIASIAYKHNRIFALTRESPRVLQIEDADNFCR